MADYQNSKWRPPKPEIEITTERNELATTPTFVAIMQDPPVTADIARRWLVTEIQDGGHHFRFRWPSY
jgi:hypothetical protein